MARFRFWRPSLDDEVNEELDFHLAMRARELEATGLSSEEARTEARRRFGDRAAMRRHLRSLGARRDRQDRLVTWWSELVDDLRQGIRTIRNQPSFSAIAILTLGLGVGTTTAIFGVVYSVVLRPLPFPEPERVMVVASGTQALGPGDVSVGNFADIRRDATAYEALGAIYWTSVNLAAGNRPDRVLAARVTAGYFRVFRATTLHGRLVEESDDTFGGPRVVVVSHRLWQRRFGGDPGLVGQSLRLDGVDHEVIGITPASFDWTTGSEELWIPAAFSPAQLAQHDEHYLTVYGRLAPDATQATAASELAGIMKRLAGEYPLANADYTGIVTPMFENFVGNAPERLLVLMGAVGLVLLIACVNVANLLLAKGASRLRELGVRASLGAGTGRLVRQLLTETAVLSSLAAIVGIGLAALTLRILVAIAPAGVPRLDTARLDAPSLAFAVALSLGTTVLAGLLPAWRLARTDLNDALRDGTRGVSSREAVKQGLVAAEIALALVLLVGAGLLIRTALHQSRIDPGFDPSPVLSGRVTLPRDAYATPEQARAAFNRIATELSQAPGVTASGLASQIPMGPGGGSNGLIPEGRPLDPASRIDTRQRIVTPGYLAAMGIPVIRGRDFTVDDVRGRPRVMMVSQGFAKLAWPGANPIGKRVVCCEGRPDDPMWKEVVGVVGDVRSRGVQRDPPLEFYLPVEQAPDASWDWIQRSMSIIARSETPSALVEPIREAVRRVDPSVAVYSLMTMDQRMAAGLAPARFNTLLLTTLGTIGLLLAAIGIYGVIGFLVIRRTREIGVRIALGASVGRVVALVLRQTIGPVAIGVAVGLIGAGIGTRALRTQLQGVAPLDPLTYGLVVAVLIGVAVAACVGPARRASRVQATEALRSD